MAVVVAVGTPAVGAAEATKEVAMLEALAMDNGAKESMFLDPPTLVLSASSSVLPMTRRSNTLASTSRSTTTFLLRRLARMFPSLFTSSPALLLMRICV